MNEKNERKTRIPDLTAPAAVVVVFVAAGFLFQRNNEKVLLRQFLEKWETMVFE